MSSKNYDFGGWATKNNLLCSDGVVIAGGAFADDDGRKVPLVWMHGHADVKNVIGHAILENRKDGVYAYCSLNDTDEGKHAKESIVHGDVSGLSIWANQIKKQGRNVVHGVIKELSVVLAGANPGAYIDTVIVHGDEGDDYESNAIIYTGEQIEHAEPESTQQTNEPTNEKGATATEVYETLNDDQKKLVKILVGIAVNDALENQNNKKNEPDDSQQAANENVQHSEGDDNMSTIKHNIFENSNDDDTQVLSQSEMSDILKDAKRYGSLRESVIQHGITDIDILFPEAEAVTKEPSLVKRDTEWVGKFLNSTTKTPLTKIKSWHANITEDEARARGYIKGKKKVNEVFGLLKRVTQPTTIYKHQQLERDDVEDIVDFDVVSWLKAEMRIMLDEELARAMLVGDGRLEGSDDKINEGNIRPIWKDDDFYTIKQTIAAKETTADVASAFIDEAVRAHIEYKGSGNPTLYAPESMITECLLLKDLNGHRLYKSMEELATAMRVKEIVSVPVMENLTRTNANSKTVKLLGIIVNGQDYTVGAKNGGKVAMFDDFDIDYNAMKYLIETRCSGAMTVPYGAIALELETA